MPQEDIPLHPLMADDIVENNKAIDLSSFTMPTEAEIKDKGKGDWVAKSLILLQMTWFVIQCIARVIEHLPVTHLEIVTIAYASIGFFIHLFWWEKPLNVDQPVRVFRKSGPSERQPRVRETISEARELNNWLTIVKSILGGQDRDLSREGRVPRFWADTTDDGHAIADLIMLEAGAFLGAVHCTAWAFSSPTHTESLIWRISSVAITAVPIFTPLVIFLATLLEGLGSEKICYDCSLFFPFTCWYTVHFSSGGHFGFSVCVS